MTTTAGEDLRSLAKSASLALSSTHSEPSEKGGSSLGITRTELKNETASTGTHIDDPCEQARDAEAVVESEEDKTERAPSEHNQEEEKGGAKTVGRVDDQEDEETNRDSAGEKEKDQSPDELTKRLQKLAIDALKREKGSQHERLQVIQADHSSHLSSAKTFQELNLPPHLLDAIFEIGFERPSAIQEEALPRILADPPRNVIGQAQSGSGKTAAFVLGMLFRIAVDRPATVQAVCVTPTRELANQIVQDAVVPMAAHMPGLKVQLALAGEYIARGKSVDAHMIVGTPGKIVDWLKRKTIDANHVKVFVLDEADKMVSESGFRANSLLIKNHMPKKCQSLLFSATFPPEVVQFATKMVANPDKILIERGPEFLILDVIKQLWIDCREYNGGKRAFLSDIYSLLTIGQSIVFVRTKREADEVHRTLTEGGYTCSLLHGEVETSDRDATMEAFRRHESTVLITTDVLARGVDIQSVCMVVNYDVPADKNWEPDHETYLHRIGRTGRFGRKGTAINLISDQRSLQILAAIEAHFAPTGKEMIQKVAADPETLADLIEI